MPPDPLPLSTEPRPGPLARVALTPDARHRASGRCARAPGSAVAGDAITRMAELANEGNLTAAMRAFADYPFTDHDIAMAEAAGYFEATGRYVPNLLNLLQQFAEHGDPADDPAVLGATSAPVLMLHGSDTKPFFARAARHVADHALNATVRAIPGAGHAAPVTHPEALAEALSEFFSLAQQPA